MHPETLAIHGGFTADPATRAVATPIYQTVAFAFDSADHAAALFDLEVEGYRYSRIANPTTEVLEKRLAALEGGAGALALASGQAALHCALSALTEGGGAIVCSPRLYGTTHTLLGHILPRLGVEARFAPAGAPADLAPLIDADTRAVFCESIGNPSGEVADVGAFAQLAHDHGLPLVVDNTVATPILLRPIEHGADIVVHSLTKFIGGHGATMGGAIVDGGRFDWAGEKRRFPAFSAPDPSYHGLAFTEAFGASAFIARCRTVWQRTTGAVLAPINAFLLLQGLETLALRMERHVANAAEVGQFLASDPRVAYVDWAGLPASPSRPLVDKYLGGRAPSLISFGVKGGLEAAKAFYDALGLIRRLVNIGDAKSLACHPASTTHRQMTAAEQRAAGVRPDTVRLSIGIEHIDDILADIDQALGAAAALAVVADV